MTLFLQQKVQNYIYKFQKNMRTICGCSCASYKHAKSEKNYLYYGYTKMAKSNIFCWFKSVYN